MKRLRSWIIPILTFLIILAVMLFPLNLSVLQDAQYLGRVHAENFTDQNNLPSQPLSFMQRIALLSCLDSDPDIISVKQEITHYSSHNTLEEKVYEELKNLSENGIIPEEIIPEDFSNLKETRLYIQQKNSSAEYIILENYTKNKGTYLFMTIDEETGITLSLSIAHPIVEKYYGELSPSQIGQCFLDRLGLESQLMHNSNFDAQFSIPEQNFMYYVLVNSSFYIQICPTAYMENDAAHSASVADSEV